MWKTHFDVLQNLDIEIERIAVKNKILFALETKQSIALENDLTRSDIPSTTEQATPVMSHTTTKKHGVLSSLIFFIKYMTTTATIFAVLMLTTNYQAYYQIAKSYIYAEEITKSEQGLLQSVHAASDSIITLDAAPEEQRQQKYAAWDTSHSTSTSQAYSMDTLVKQTIASTDTLDIDITPYENRIIVPKIGKNIPLVEVTQELVGDEKELNDIFMTELENGVVRYPSSVKPGEDGNTFIFGHSSNFPWIKWNYNEVFALLDKVSYGDEIIIYYEQKKYVYRILEKKVIDPKNVGVINKHSLTPELTLMTCWPIGTTLNRLIVSGELIEETDL